MPKETIIDILIVTLLALAIFVRYQSIKLIPPLKDTSYEITATLQQIPKISGQYQRFKLGQVTIIARYPPVYNYGDQLTVTGTLNPKLEMPFPKIISASHSTRSPADRRGEVGLVVIQSKLLEIRSVLSNQLAKYLPSPEAELVAGSLWGEKANLPADFNKALKDTGVIHMVVVSGYNISVIAGVLMALFAVFGRKGQAVLTISGITLFVMLSGAESPAIRAGVMGGLVVIGRYFGREKDTMRLLAISALVMLLINPLYIEDVGFQLSFLATLGILIFGKSNKKDTAVNNGKKSELILNGILIDPKIDRYSDAFGYHFGLIRIFWNKLKDSTIIEELRTTLAAQILVIPIIATTFGRLSLISPVANLAVGWTIPYLMAGGALLTAISSFSSLGGRVLGAILVVPASFYVSMVTVLAKVPYAAVDFKLGPGFVVVYYLVVWLFLIIKNRKM